jgi:hypothetical protein
MFVPAKEGFVRSKDGDDSYWYEGLAYVPTEKPVKDGEIYHLKNLKTGAIMVMDPKKNETYFLEKDLLDNKYKKKYG